MRKGFTLFEIIVVFGLIALISTVSAVYLRAYQSKSILDSSARDVLSNLRLASELASTTQIIHSVHFDLQNSNYRITNTSTPNTIIKSTTLDPSISIASTTLTDQTAQFNILGAATVSGTITLTDKNNTQKIIDLRPSGYVEIR